MSEDPHLDDEQPEDVYSEDEPADEIPIDVQEHFERREAFRSHVMSLRGARFIRFYGGYADGRADFKDEAAATEALDLFDSRQFADVELHQSSDNKNRLEFYALPQSKGMQLGYTFLDTRVLSNTANALSPSLLQSPETLASFERFY